MQLCSHCRRNTNASLVSRLVPTRREVGHSLAALISLQGLKTLQKNLSLALCVSSCHVMTASVSIKTEVNTGRVKTVTTWALTGSDWWTKKEYSVQLVDGLKPGLRRRSATRSSGAARGSCTPLLRLVVTLGNN